MSCRCEKLEFRDRRSRCSRKWPRLYGNVLASAAPPPHPATLSIVARKQTAAARYAEYTGLALLLPVSTFVGYAIGYYLDKAFGTTWMQIAFLILGSVAGFVALIRQVMRDSH